jgi:hypothetical protein
MANRFLLKFSLSVVALLALAIGVFQVTAANPLRSWPSQISSVEAVPAKISYQGMLTDGGSPVNGNRNMVFRLFTTSNCSGTALAAITKNNVPLQNGLFHVILDINPAHFNGQALRLQVQVGATVLGCEEVLPTPYTLFSASTGSLHMRPVSAVAPATNQVLRWSGTEWTPVADNNHSHFGHDWSGTNTGYALLISNAGTGDGLRSFAATSNGNIWGAVYAVNSGTSPGIYANTGSSGTYSAYFPKSIFVGGSCVGCAMVYTAQNTGATPLQPGDLVAISGLAAPLLGTSVPLIQVEVVNAANAFAAIGVVQSRGLIEASEKEGERLESINMAPGTADVGEFVFVVVQGMAQVRVQSGIQAGDLLVVGTNGRIQPQTGDLPLFEIGRAMESADPETGLAWVLVGVR